MLFLNCFRLQSKVNRYLVHLNKNQLSVDVLGAISRDEFQKYINNTKMDRKGEKKQAAIWCTCKQSYACLFVLVVLYSDIASFVSFRFFLSTQRLALANRVEYRVECKAAEMFERVSVGRRS